MTLGSIFLPYLPPERLLDVARAADDAGVEELWLWEDCFRESGVASAAAALAATTRVRVGVGLLPVPLRNVALTAMESATLARMFPGRVTIGVGHGVQDWMAQVGARVESPMTLLREHVSALRALLRGDEVTVSGRYVTLDRVRLDWPPATPPPIAVGAIKPRTLALAGELADGTILTAGTTTGEVRAARAALTAAGAGPDHRITVYVFAATGPDADTRLAREIALWGDEPGTGITGSLADGVAPWFAAGADAVILQPTRDDPDLDAFLHAVAGAARARAGG